MNYQHRKFREQDGYVIGRFQIEGSTVKYLDLPSQPIPDSLVVTTDGNEIRFPCEELESVNTVIWRTGDQYFRNGQVVEFRYQRDPESLFQEGDMELNRFSPEALLKADAYTYVIKKDDCGDHAVFIMECPSLSVFASTPYDALHQARCLMTWMLESEDLPDPFGFYEIPNLTDQL